MKNAARFLGFCLVLVSLSILCVFPQQAGSEPNTPAQKNLPGGSNEILNSLRQNLREALTELEASEARYGELQREARELTRQLTEARTLQQNLEASLTASAEQLTEAQNGRRSLEERLSRLETELKKASTESDASRRQAEEAQLHTEKLEDDLKAASEISKNSLRPTLNDLEDSVRNDAQRIRDLTLQRNLLLGGGIILTIGGFFLGAMVVR
jgi:chromosome segregation ATPase